MAMSTETQPQAHMRTKKSRFHNAKDGRIVRASFRRTTYYRRALNRLVSCHRPPSLSCVVQASSDAVDGRAQRIFQLRQILALLLSPQ